MKRLILLFLLLALLGSGGAYYLLSVPYGQFPKPIFVEIPKGSGVRSIGRRLAQAGVLRYDWQLLAARFLRSGNSLKAGEYRFDQPASALEIYDRLARGDSFFYELTIPEGSNLFEIAKALDTTPMISSQDFLATVRDPALIRDLDPAAPSLEGYLFPATYRLTRSATAKGLAREMTDRFRRAWKELGGPPDPHRIVTLASLVEEEAAAPKDRPLIAAVFVNRLKKGMTLDCDPTTMYAALLENRYRGKIYRSDLESQNPYNTYRHAGLPPGPIANPGLESLKAALHPAEADYLFFVAKPDGSGRHTFSATLNEHNQAVQEYRRGQQKPQQAPSVAAVPGAEAARDRR